MKSVALNEKLFIYPLPIFILVVEMGEIVVKVPEDIGIELGRVSEEIWR
jgi:hypothetical protein